MSICILLAFLLQLICCQAQPIPNHYCKLSVILQKQKTDFLVVPRICPACTMISYYRISKLKTILHFLHLWTPSMMSKPDARYSSTVLIRRVERIFWRTKLYGTSFLSTLQYFSLAFLRWRASYFYLF